MLRPLQLGIGAGLHTYGSGGKGKGGRRDTWRRRTEHFSRHVLQVITLLNQSPGPSPAQQERQHHKRIHVQENSVTHLTSEWWQIE